MTETLPTNLSSYRCVALLDNSFIAESETNALAGYIRGGGTIVAIGEHEGPPYAEGDETLNQFAETLGVGLALNVDSYDAGHDVTTSIYPSPLTEDVSALGENWASSITVATTGSAQPLVGTAEGDATPRRRATSRQRNIHHGRRLRLVIISPTRGRDFMR